MKKFFAIVLIFPMLVAVGLMFSACGEPKEPQINYQTDVTKMEFISQVIDSKEDQNLTMIGVIFASEPQSISATYKGQQINLEKEVVEDYEGPESGVNGYQYSYTLADKPTVTTYDTSPIEITTQFNGTHYKFTLTTDLIDRILGM